MASLRGPERQYSGLTQVLRGRMVASLRGPERQDGGLRGPERQDGGLTQRS